MKEIIPPLKNPAETDKPLWHVLSLDFRYNIQKSPIHGHGLFANEKLHTDHVIINLDGQLITIGDFSRILKSVGQLVEEHSRNYFFMEWNYVDLENNKNLILVRPYRTMYSYINHSRKPNCCILGNAPYNLRVLAVTEIEAGEELTLDYRKEKLPRSYLDGYGGSYL